MALKIFPSMTELYGLSTVFFIHGIITILGILVAACFLPETKDKSLTELNLLYTGKRDEYEEK